MVASEESKEEELKGNKSKTPPFERSHWEERRERILV